MYVVHISFRLYIGEYNKRTVCVQVRYDKRSVCVCVYKSDTVKEHLCTSQIQPPLIVIPFIHEECHERQVK
jgi:hypothetical protein